MNLKQVNEFVQRLVSMSPEKLQDTEYKSTQEALYAFYKTIVLGYYRLYGMPQEIYDIFIEADPSFNDYLEKRNEELRKQCLAIDSELAQEAERVNELTKQIEQAKATYWELSKKRVGLLDDYMSLMKIDTPEMRRTRDENHRRQLDEDPCGHFGRYGRRGDC